MKTDKIKLSEDPSQDIAEWINTNPTATIKFILGDINSGRYLIIIYELP